MDRIIQTFISKRLWTLGVLHRIHIKHDHDWSLYYTFDGIGPDVECHILLYNERLTRMIIQSRILQCVPEKCVSLQKTKVLCNVYLLSAVMLDYVTREEKSSDDDGGVVYHYLCAPSIIGERFPKLVVSSTMVSTEGKRSVSTSHENHYGFKVTDVSVNTNDAHVTASILCYNKEPDYCLECCTKKSVLWNLKYLNMIVNC